MPEDSHNERVYVDRSPIHGKGLFAASTLPVGQLIGVYDGPQVEDDDTHVLWVEDESGGGWTGYDGRNEMRFMNHSAQPNAEMDGLHCYAREEIPAGTEITIDYGWDDS
ncbi:MAG: SET domain-containing protein [Xanthomonadales bacterium]|jgi:SET domain-containing protein|nr:SET domain-containing protein [Xanthomonadales bacterium]